MRDESALCFPAAWSTDMREFFETLDVQRRAWLHSIGEGIHTMQPYVDYCEELRILDEVADAVYVRDDAGSTYKAVRIAWPGPPPWETERWKVVRETTGGEGFWWRHPRASWTSGHTISETFRLEVFERLQRISRDEFDQSWQASQADQS